MKAIFAFGFILLSSHSAFASDISRTLKENFPHTQVKQAEELGDLIVSLSDISPENAGQTINAVSSDLRQIDLDEMADAAAELELGIRDFLSDSGAPANEAITELSNFFLQTDN